LLSQALVAFTIEFDNCFEQRFSHRTTCYGATDSDAPWLVSMAMWANVVRYVPAEGIAARDLVIASSLTKESMQHLLRRLSRWWGYLQLSPDRTVRLTEAGARAQQVWTPLASEIEGRWAKRYGVQTVEELRSLLATVVARCDRRMPAYLPGGTPRLAVGQPDDQGDLFVVISRALLDFAVGCDDRLQFRAGYLTAGPGARLMIAANVFRVLHEPVRMADLPRITGVAKITLETWVKNLASNGYLQVSRDGRGRVVSLTPQGEAVRATYLALDPGWPEQATLHELLSALDLWAGLDPPTGGWRANLPRPDTLPHHPVVSLRGGFPDGS
jgi:Mn-dependent DtxR family transcriptional regulator